MLFKYTIQVLHHKQTEQGIMLNQLLCIYLIVFYSLLISQEDMSSLILSYLEGGQVTEALQRYVKNRNCAAQAERFTRKYGLDHTGGLFIILLSAMFVGAFLLVIELCVFRYLVPYLRKKPNDSLWKNRNIEYVNQVTIAGIQITGPYKETRRVIRSNL